MYIDPGTVVKVWDTAPGVMPLRSTDWLPSAAYRYPTPIRSTVPLVTCQGPIDLPAVNV